MRSIGFALFCAALLAPLLCACASNQRAQQSPEILFTNSTNISVWVRMDSAARAPEEQASPSFIPGHVMRIGPRLTMRHVPPMSVNHQTVMIYRIAFAAVSPTWEPTSWRTYEIIEEPPKRIRLTRGADGQLEARADGANVLIPVP